MRLSIFDDDTALADAAAGEILSEVARKPHAVLCLAAGDTPLKTYRLLGGMAKSKGIDFSRTQFVALDEWVGINPWNSGSCHYFLKHALFDPLQVANSNQHYFDAMSDNMERECQTMNSFIADSGGIDLMLVGVGMNGHIGFNEPGVSSDLYAHVTALDDTTLRVGQKYFTESTKLSMGVTLGLRHFLEARKVIVMATGPGKAAIMKRALEGDVSSGVPASIVRTHPCGTVMIDQGAASMLANPAPS